MPKIDRLVLRLPADFAGRGPSLARAVAAALGERPPVSRSAKLGPVAPGTSDTAIAGTVARTLAKGRS